ncbi:TPA: lytic transglycosylase domain-containing protein, partial [Proteus mirabilis]
MRKNSLLMLVLLLFSVPLPAREVPPGYREVARQENVPAEA